MRKAIAALAARRRAMGQDPFEVGIGVSLGEVVAGTVGTEDAWSTRSSATAVNVASASKTAPSRLHFLTRRTL